MVRAMGETTKADERRIREGWYRRFIRWPLLDIGAGDDPFPSYGLCRHWDKPDGDATMMEGVPAESYATVYASHVLEHLDDPARALTNWWRILNRGGFLIVIVPHCDLYEKQRYLPSRWNSEHKTLWLPFTNAGEIRGLFETLFGALSPLGAVFHSVRTIDFGYQAGAVDEHPGGEYSIEAIVRK